MFSRFKEFCNSFKSKLNGHWSTSNSILFFCPSSHTLPSFYFVMLIVDKPIKGFYHVSPLNHHTNIESRQEVWLNVEHTNFSAFLLRLPSLFALFFRWKLKQIKGLICFVACWNKKRQKKTKLIKLNYFPGSFLRHFFLFASTSTCSVSVFIFFLLMFANMFAGYQSHVIFVCL